MSNCECGICAKCRNREACRRYRERHPDREKARAARGNLKKKESGYYLKWYAANENARKAALDRNKKRAKVSPEKVRAEVKRHQEKHRDKYLARQWVRRAVARGKIIKPKNCQICNIEASRIEGHHEDYSKRLEVLWLCVDCHKKIHGKCQEV